MSIHICVKHIVIIVILFILFYIISKKYYKNGVKNNNYNCKSSDKSDKFDNVLAPTTTSTAVNYGVLDYIDNITTIDTPNNLTADTIIDTPQIVSAIEKCANIQDDNNTLVASNVLDVLNNGGAFVSPTSIQSPTSTISTQSTPSTTSTQLYDVTCQNIYSQYLANNYDINAVNINVSTTILPMYKSLSQICPVTCRTPEYNNCNDIILNKYQNGISIAEDIGTQVNNIIASNINNTVDKLSNISTSLQDDMATPQISNYYTYEKLNYPINTVNNTNNATNNANAANTTNIVNNETNINNTLLRINDYYKNKSMSGVEKFISVPTFQNMTPKTNVLSEIQLSSFGGTYKILPSYILLDNLTCVIDGLTLSILDINNQGLITYTFDSANTVNVTDNTGLLSTVNISGINSNISSSSSLSSAPLMQPQLQQSNMSAGGIASTIVSSVISSIPNQSIPLTTQNLNPNNANINLSSLPGICLRIISAKVSNTTNDENVTQIFNLLATIGLKKNTFIYVISNTNNNYSILNRDYTTLFQMKRIN